MNAQNLFDTYFENIRVISGLFFSNSRFTLELYGDSFSSAWPLLCRQSDHELSCSYPSCHALFVHTHSVVAEDKSFSSSVDEDRVLKFVGKNVGPVVNGDFALCLRSTADAGALLEAGNVELSAKLLVADADDADQYFLSGHLPAGSFLQRILMCYTPVIELSESDSPAVVFDHRAVKTTVAVACEKWPATAASWATRCPPWISYDVLNIATASSVYFVPKPISRCCVGTESQKHMIWKSEFVAAEDVLMKCFGDEIKIAYQLLLQLAIRHHLSCCCVSQDLLVRHALFWCLDEISVAGNWNKKSAVEYYVCTLKKLHSFLLNRHFPHYFMPDVNILCNCDCSVGDIAWMAAEVTGCTAVQQKAEVILQTLTCTSSDITCSLSRHLRALFAYSVSMSFTQLFHYLHAGAFIDHLIVRHCDMLDHLHSSSLGSRRLFLKPLIAWMKSSLGTMYLVKACTASSDWANCAENAEHCMLEAVAGNNMPSCTLYLIQFLLQKKCYQEANSYMEMLLASAEFSAILSRNSVENCTNGASAFSDQLLAVWRHATWHIDIMFSPIEVSVLVPQLESSLSFAYYDKIGYCDSPVAVMKLEFWMQYIGALCCAHGDHARALKFLADAERGLADSALQTVGSDRAHITYFNMLAGILVIFDQCRDVFKYFQYLMPF